MDTNEKIFLVINLSNFGDVLLTNTLCQNIKLEYPNSKVIFIANKPFIEAAKYQKDVDEVFALDKKGKHKGLTGLLKFVNTFPYKNKVFASFVIYGNDRGIILSRLIGSKHVVSGSGTITKYLITNPCKANGFTHMQDINGEFLEAITKKRSQTMPIKVIPPKTENKIAQSIKERFSGKDIIGLTLVSKLPEKDMPIETAAELIQKLNEQNKVPVLLGKGEATKHYSIQLKKLGTIDFIDLTDATSISNLMQILLICKALISVDTGTMHLACALDVPVISVFYKKDNVQRWAPRNTMYKSVIITENCSAEKILEETNQFIEEKIYT